LLALPAASSQQGGLLLLHSPFALLLLQEGRYSRSSCLDLMFSLFPCNHALAPSPSS
jgi:hypothetical protein